VGLGWLQDPAAQAALDEPGPAGRRWHPRGARVSGRMRCRVPAGAWDVPISRGVRQHCRMAGGSMGRAREVRLRQQARGRGVAKAGARCVCWAADGLASQPGRVCSRFYACHHVSA